MSYAFLSVGNSTQKFFQQSLPLLLFSLVTLFLMINGKCPNPINLFPFVSLLIQLHIHSLIMIKPSCVMC